MHFLDRVHRPADGAVAVGVVLEVRLEDRFQHELGGGLDHPIPDRRDTRVELHSFPTNLWVWLKSSTHFIHCAVSGLSS